MHHRRTYFSLFSAMLAMTFLGHLACSGTTAAPIEGKQCALPEGCSEPKTPGEPLPNDPNPEQDPPDAAIDASPDAAADSAPAVDASPDRGDKKISIWVEASGEPFAHKDGFSGQTPKAQALGIAALYMQADGDNAPTTRIFDFGVNGVDTPLTPGSSTEVAQVNLKDVPAGKYSRCRTYVTTASYTVSTMMHAFGFKVPGTIRGVHVLSDGATIGPASGKSGAYHFAFQPDAGGMPYSYGGENFPFAQAGPAFALQVEGGRAFYAYDCALTVPRNSSRDLRVTMKLNMDRNFRWSDSPSLGYQNEVFDATPTASETVQRFGANSFSFDVR
jgi:hypothetical protein